MQFFRPGRKGSEELRTEVPAWVFRPALPWEAALKDTADSRSGTLQGLKTCSGSQASPFKRET